MSELAPLAPLALLAVVLAAVAGGAVQAALGFGASFTTVPVLAVVAPSLVPVAVLVGLVPLTVLIAWRDRTSLDRAGFVRIAVARLPGIAAGTVLVALAPTAVLQLVIAGVLVAAVAASALGARIHVTPASQAVAGVVSGFTGTAAALGGPPLALLYRDRTGADRRATLSAVFAVGTLLALASLGWAGQVRAVHLTVGALLALAMLTGSVVAVPVVRRASDAALRTAVLTWAAAGAVVAVVRVATTT